MDRRYVSQALLAGSLAALATRPSQAQTACGGDPCYQQTDSEAAAVPAININDDSLPPGTLERYAAPDQAFRAGETEVRFRDGFHAFASDQINIGPASQLCRVTGPGHLQQLQQSPHKNLLIVDGYEATHPLFPSASFSLEGLIFSGIDPGNGFGNPSSVDTCVTIRNRSGVVVSGCTFRYWGYYGLLLENCNDVVIIGNRFSRCPYPIRMRNCQRVTIVGNTFNDSYLANNAFGVGIGLDSNDPIGGPGGPVFAPCKQVTIVGNTFDSLFNSQGILVHAGSIITISGNTFRNMALPISLNPATTTDLIRRIAITGNAIECAEPSIAAYTNGDVGINCQGGPISGGQATIDPTEITISDNEIYGANGTLRQAAFAAIRVGYSRSVSITGNRIVRPYGTGILCTNCPQQISITGNSISDVANAQGARRGINVTGSVTNAIVSGNHLFDIGGTGIRTEANGKMQVRHNLFYNVTTQTEGVSNT